MKILHIIDSPIHILGGAESVVLQQIEISRNSGYDVSLLQFGSSPEALPNKIKVDSFTHNPIKHLNVQWHSGNLNRISNLFRIILGNYDPIGEAEFLTIVRRINPDLIHFNCINSPGYLRPLGKLGTPLIVNFPGFIFQCPKGGMLHRSNALCKTPPLFCSIRNLLLKSLYGIPDIVTAQSKFSRRLLIEAGFCEDKVRLLYNPVEYPNEVKEKNAWSKQIIFAGKLTATKGLFDLIEAINVNAGANVKLCICGDGPLRDEVIKQAFKNPERIEYFGRLEHNDLFSVYSKVDAAIIPSKAPESFCLAAAEALCNGLPVLGTRVGALSELIIDGYTGYSFLPGDPTGIIKAMTRLYADRAKYLHMVENARKFSKKFSNENHSNSLLNIYKELM